MTTLISLILIPLDLIAADWTIKWAKMSRRRRRRHDDDDGRGMFGQRESGVAAEGEDGGCVKFLSGP